MRLLSNYCDRYFILFYFFFISQFRIHSSSIEFFGFSGMYIKIGDDTSKLWVIREHDIVCTD